VEKRGAPAKMNTLKDWHPDIEEFIDAKQKEEKKAWALIEQGYDGSYNGDAYGSVMYQNENVSVRVSDEFMEGALEGREWWTRRVTDGKPCERKEARTLLRKIRRRHISAAILECSSIPRSTNGTLQRHGPSKFNEPMLGISVP
jgi:Ribonucleotide reductase, alpha subunit